MKRRVWASAVFCLLGAVSVAGAAAPPPLAEVLRRTGKAVEAFEQAVAAEFGRRGFAAPAFFVASPSAGARREW